MKPLAISYSKNGYNFALVKRVEDVAIYKQTSQETGRTLAFEVFEIQKNKTKNFGGKIIDPWESIPSNEDWGRLAFTVWSIPKAEEKMQYLLDQMGKRKIGQTQKVSGDSSQMIPKRKTSEELWTK